MAFFTDIPKPAKHPKDHLTLCRGEKCPGTGCACWCHPEVGRGGPQIMFTRTGNNGGGTIPR